MACACAMGNWSTGRVQTNVVQTENVKNFLGMTQKHGPNGFYPVPTVTDSGVERNANWASVAASAVVAVNTMAAIDIARKQYNIARDYYKLAERKWDRFLSKYGPCERKEMAEACNTPEYTKEYDARASEYGNEVSAAFTDVDRRMGDIFTQYCICPDETLGRDLDMTRAIMEADSMNFAYRREEHRKVAMDDRRWTRRQQALNRGRDLQSNAAKYAEMAANAYGDVGGNIGKAAEGAMTAIGYFQNRRDTVYPQRTEMNRPGGAMVGDGFTGLTPQNGTYGWISPTPSPVNSDLSVYNYDNANTVYSTPNAIGSMVGAQQPSSSGA